MGYRGRLAPSPTGLLHLGHGRTFWIAHQRAQAAKGTLILRMEDLDRARCREEFVRAAYEDLQWLGIEWMEGPDCGGPCAPYAQSERMALYRETFEQLRKSGSIYPCTCTRQDVLRSLQAPHAGEEEPIYPGTCRAVGSRQAKETPREGVNWRFRVPDHTRLEFHDALLGPQHAVAGRDFGDFVVWRKDDLPSYQLAVTSDDAAMGVTEVVRGEDLVGSTYRQLLLYEALGHSPPAFAHCELVYDEHGQRLAKRHDALSLRALRDMGHSPEQTRLLWFDPPRSALDNPPK